MANINIVMEMAGPISEFGSTLRQTDIRALIFTQARVYRKTMRRRLVLSCGEPGTQPRSDLLGFFLVTCATSSRID